MDIGIIGGADGPTAIFLASSRNSYITILVFICIVIFGLVSVIAYKRKGRH